MASEGRADSHARRGAFDGGRTNWRGRGEPWSEERGGNFGPPAGYLPTRRRPGASHHLVVLHRRREVSFLRMATMGVLHPSTTSTPTSHFRHTTSRRQILKVRSYLVRNSGMVQD